MTWERFSVDFCSEILPDVRTGKKRLIVQLAA